MRHYQDHQCRHGPPSIPRDSWSARICSLPGQGRGGKHERRRIGEYPITTYMSVVLPCRSVQRRAHATVSHYLTWLPELPCIFAALAEHAFWPGRAAGATSHVRSPSFRMSKTPPPDSASFALAADSVPPGAQVVRASSLDLVSLRTLTLSRCGGGSQRVRLADDDAEDAGAALGPWYAQWERGEFAVVPAVDEELPICGVPEICDQRPSPISPLLSSSSVLRHSRSAVPPTSSAGSTTGQHPLLIGIHRCGPERHPITGRSVLESRGHPWTACLSASGWDVSTTDLGFGDASLPSSVPISTSPSAGSTLGLWIGKRSTRGYQRTAQSDHIVLSSTSTARRSA